jgi:hypothetical protein
MRDKPDLWKGSERIQWGCVLMQLMGESSLEHLHLVLSGLRSVERSHQPAPYQQQLWTARVILGDLLTKQSVQNAVAAFHDSIVEDDAGADKRVARSFDIDVVSLCFTARYAPGLDPNVAIAEQVLAQALPRHANNRRIADTSKDHLITLSADDNPVRIRLGGLSFPEIRMHERSAQPRQPLTIQWQELVVLAQTLDAEDHDADRPSRSWAARIRQIQLETTTGHGLEPTSTLDLSGLKHLIGLPGAGKSTLICLLCILLARRGQRAAVFFTAIEVAREYLEVLRCYEVTTALLMGHSGQTHLHHANDLAELIAGQGNGGFARTRDGAELFATSCPLPAFSDEWPHQWQSGDAPCESLTEQASQQAYASLGTGRWTQTLCPAWELCGRVRNQRELVTANVWLGHVRSSDTGVPAHTSHESLQYFELIAEGFDLVIFDECDEAQRVLDEFGTLTLHLTGSAESFHSQVEGLLGSVASNRIRYSDGVVGYALEATEFARHTLRFLREISHLNQSPQTRQYVDRYADQLLTTHLLMREALNAAGTRDQLDNQVLTAISDFWETAMYRAFFNRGARTQRWLGAKKYASSFGISSEEASAAWQRLHDAFIRYLSQQHNSLADVVIDVIVTEIARLLRAPSSEKIRIPVRLLIVVGFTIASYQTLARAARPLAQRGEIPGDLVFAKASRELREHVPRALLGTLSAVRFRRAAESNGYEIDYLVMDLAPRLLLHRLNEIGRAHVLLASATSWLAPSTAYHVERQPDYVLLPPSGDLGSVRLYVHPQIHPVTRKPLRYSGAGEERTSNLRYMVHALAHTEGGGLSELERAVRSTTTVNGRRRMAALVVNSYEQVQLVVEEICNANALLGARTRGVLKQLPADDSRARYVLRGQVEELSQDEQVDIVVFPIGSLGRGVNIVFRSADGDNGRAAVGSLYFLTRPHPGAGDLGLMTSLLAQATHAFDRGDFGGDSLASVQQRYTTTRVQLLRRVANLLSRPMSASRLDRETLTNFAANLLVPILQAIGRGMRKQMPVAVYFVDAAWAPNSVNQMAETDRSSLLVAMREILRKCLADPDPDLQDIYHALYGVFETAFTHIAGLIPPEEGVQTPDDLFEPSLKTVLVDFDHSADFEEVDAFDDFDSADPTDDLAHPSE